MHYGGNILDDNAFSRETYEENQSSGTCIKYLPLDVYQTTSNQSTCYNICIQTNAIRQRKTTLSDQSNLLVIWTIFLNIDRITYFILSCTFFYNR